MAKPLSLNEIRRRGAQFAIEWRDSPGDERQSGQSFIRDLLQVYGITATKAALYERRAKRSSTGGRGYIDALVPGLCAIEMKSTGKDLEAAVAQALDYLDDLPDAETPRFVIASDFRRFRVLDIEAPEGEDTRDFTLDELPANIDALAFLAGYQKMSFGDREQEIASVKAARIMADLYEALSDSGYDDHEASVFLVRVLFCLYADDAGVWERDLFYEFLERRTNDDGSDLGPQLAMLFQAMNREAGRRQRNLDDLIARFPYVNGGIFAERADIPSFDKGMRDLLLQACAFNWSQISPAIFGSLFQAVKDSKARRELGEHYTTETNILKTIQPLFLDELRARFAENLYDAAKLKRLRSDLGQLRVMDPACGCGNFLVVAYRELRALDLQVVERLQALGDTSWRSPTAFFLKEDLPVTLDHFTGIEIEEWPARIASTALHLVDHQANQAMELALGQAPDPLPLDKIDTIHVANALRTEWSQIVAPSKQLYIIGNPPFVGYDYRTDDQKADLMHVWATKSIGRLDYVTCWYKRSLELFARNGYDGEFAFVSTNSVTQGEPVAKLFDAVYSAGWQIKFAHRTFLWTSEAPEAAAKVHCVIIGFRRRGGRFSNFRLFEYESVEGLAIERRARRINPYLLDAPDIIVRKRSGSPLSTLPKVINGNVAGDTRRGEGSRGGLVMSEAEAAEVRNTDPIASKYLRPFIGGEDFLNGKIRYCLWLKDVEPADISASFELRRRLANVTNVRERSTEPTTVKLARTPHLFKHIAQPEANYVCIPRTVPDSRRYLAVGYLSPEYIVSNGSFWAEDPSGVVFAVASSSMFMAWQRAIGGRIKSDPRFANTLTWNTFPFQVESERELEEISIAGKAVLEARDANPGRTLAEHYNPLAMSPTLLKAHDALDRAVDRAFGVRKGVPVEEERQQILFERYGEITGTAK